MKPYYQDSAVTIYHGDCREILTEIDAVDFMLTCPPWGVKAELISKTAKRLAWSISGERRKNAYGQFDDSPESVWSCVIPAIKTALLNVKRAIITPGNRCLTMYPPPDSFGVFYQPASTGLQRWGRCDAQPIFYYGAFPRESRMIPGTNLSFVLTESPEANGHPCPKPIDAWMKLMTIGSVDGETVIDPFMGSGTTLRAAKDLGRKAIGIEIEERYCEIAARRMAQEVLPFESKYKTLQQMSLT